MSAILFSLLESGLRFMLFIEIAQAGIVCGEKLWDSGDAKNVDTPIEKR